MAAQQEMSPNGINHTSHQMDEGAQPRRRLVVVKRKKAVKRSRPTASRGLPSFGVQAVTANNNAANDNNQVETKNRAHNGENAEESNDPWEQALAALPNDTALVLQGLQLNPDTYLNIPLPSGEADVRAVLPLHVHEKFSASNEAREHSELAGLLADNTLRQLQSTPTWNAGSGTSTSSFTLTVLVITTDYVRAVRSIASSPAQAASVEWFLKILPHLTGQVLDYADFQAQWQQTQSTNTTSMSLDQTLATLCQLQCLLMRPTVTPPSYQLWLPTWGLVLQAWSKAVTKVRRQLQRSSYRERSQSALQQPYSPISTNLILDWMQATGQVSWADRPAGRFVRLPVPRDDEEDDDNIICVYK